MTSRVTRFAAATVLIALLSACQMTVQVTTHLNGKGGGTLALRMSVDKELRDSLEGSKGSQGMAAIEDLFGRLRSQGWTVARVETAGGLDLQATRAFADQKAFDSVVSELSGGGTSPLGALGYSLGYKTRGSFLKTKTDFSGSVDTTALLTLVETLITKGSQKDAEQFLSAAAENLHFEIRAILPGSVTVQSGDGTVSNGVAVWRPKLGSRVAISASSTALKSGSLMAVGIPALLVLAGLGWFFIGRRQRSIIAEAPTPADRRRDRISLPLPAEQLLAIIPDVQGSDEPSSPPTVIELDLPEPVLPAEPTG
jgi:hypothetical protein